MFDQDYSYTYISLLWNKADSGDYHQNRVTTTDTFTPYEVL